MLSTLQAVWRENRRVLSNFLSLSAVQCANYLAPLITLPYLTRVLELSNYGLVEFARAISVYFLILTDYSFSLSATRQISIHRQDADRVSEVFSAVMLLRFGLVALSLGALAALVFGVPRLRADWPVYFLSFGSVIGMWLFPIWLFQGLECMRPIATLSITAKLLVIVAIFVFVRGPDDYLYVPLLQSGGTILTGGAALVLALRRFPVRWRIPPLAVLGREFMEGWQLFLSKMAITLYTTGNIVILGLCADTTAVAYYAAADKIVRAVQGLQLPLSQAIFPHLGRLASESRSAALAFAAHVVRIVSVVTLGFSVALFVAAPYLAWALLGERYAGGVAVLRILSFHPFITALSNLFGFQIMANFGLERALTRILVAAGVLNLLPALLLVVPWQHRGIAVASLLTETFVTTAMFLTLRRHHLNVLPLRIPARAVSAEA